MTPSGKFAHIKTQLEKKPKMEWDRLKPTLGMPMPDVNMSVKRDV